MNGLFETIDGPFVSRLGSTLLHFLWQGAALGLVALALIGALHRASPAARYAAFLSVLILMALYVAVVYIWAV